MLIWALRGQREEGRGEEGLPARPLPHPLINRPIAQSAGPRAAKRLEASAHTSRHPTSCTPHPPTGAPLPGEALGLQSPNALLLQGCYALIQPGKGLRGVGQGTGLLGLVHHVG